MYANSRQVVSDQDGVHPALSRLHPQAVDFQKPVDAITANALDTIERIRENFDALIFDHACGFAESTQAIAKANPQALVIGIERSPHRLASFQLKNNWYRDNNQVLLLADCIDVWLQAGTRGWQAAKQYFLYPNPWPKQSQLRRRWHAHPAFPTVLELGGAIEMRTNWRTYAEEFSEVLRSLEPQRVTSLDEHEADAALTRFERKYADSGHSLYRVFSAY